MIDVTNENVLKRVFWLYGVYALLSNVFLVLGYFFLPEGIIRDTPLLWAGNVAAKPTTSGGVFAIALLFNLGIMAPIGVGLNLIRNKGFPQGYCFPIVMGIFRGLLLGTNSFVAIDLSNIPYRAGTAIGFTIGGLEMLGYICIVASTVKLGIYQFQNWWQWNEKPHKAMSLRDVRFSVSEMACLFIGVSLIVIAAYRESFGAWVF